MITAGSAGAPRGQLRAGCVARQQGLERRGAARLARGLADDVERGHPGRLGRLGRLVGEAAVGDQCPCAGVLQLERDLRRLEQHVHRHHDAAGLEYAEVGDDELRDVRQLQTDPVARREAGRREAGRDPVGQLVELRIAELAVAQDHRRLARRPPGRLPQHHREVEIHHRSSRPLCPRRLRSHWRPNHRKITFAPVGDLPGGRRVRTTVRSEEKTLKSLPWNGPWLAAPAHWTGRRAGLFGA